MLSKLTVPSFSAKSVSSLPLPTLFPGKKDVLEHLADPASQINNFSKIMDSNSIALFNWYFYKGDKNEYPFHIDDSEVVEKFFETLQSNFLEVFHPILITTRAYKKIR